MKRFLTILVAVFAFLNWSCTKEQEPAQIYLEVTPNNLEGTWKLVEWNGLPLAEGSFAYLVLTRRDREFTSYDNFESQVTSVSTGTYDIWEEDNAIGGIFDHSIYEPWSHRYVVSELTASRMVWTAQDDASQTRVYERVEALPEGIL